MSSRGGPWRPSAFRARFLSRLSPSTPQICRDFPDPTALDELATGIFEEAIFGAHNSPQPHGSRFVKPRSPCAATTAWITVEFEQGLFQPQSTQPMALLFCLLGECGKLIAVLLIPPAIIDSQCHFANSNAVVPKGSTSGGSESRQGPRRSPATSPRSRSRRSASGNSWRGRVTFP